MGLTVISGAGSAEDNALAQARRIVALHQKRDQLFQGCGVSGLFADASWCMLIDLFIAARTSRLISVSSLCIASQVPQTTALRHIAIMVEKGLIVRQADPNDSRRVLLSLSPSTLEMMETVLS
ncbi:MAG TPA: hypothetical protein VF503_08015 [Sphingobium sp.]|uniref:hypothetical protein n=1 Tax=Sphingobium sp. TaxID=1912891 RepID=UPI002ED216C1